MGLISQKLPGMEAQLAASSRDPFAADTRHIAIVGAGYAGTMLAWHLHQLASAREMRVSLIDPGAGISLGLAYSTDDPSHLLNVPASRMSALVDAPRDFIDWCQARRILEREKDGFVPRRVFREYVLERFAGQLSAPAPGATVGVINDSVSAIRQAAAMSFAISLHSGIELQADAVVLATGNQPPLVPEAFRALSDTQPERVSAALHQGWADRIEQDDRVILAGTGLTMVDAALTLQSRGHRGELIAISRRGLLPVAHRKDWRGVRPTQVPLEPARGCLSMLQTLRNAVREGERWDALLAGMRREISALWTTMPPAEKQRFLRHLRTIWDVHRHRMAPASASAIRTMQESGTLKIIAGTFSDASALAGDRISVSYRARGTDEMRSVEGQRLVLCTGPDTSLVASPLLAQMQREGLLCADPNDLGVKAMPSGKLLNARGESDLHLYAIGSLLRGTLWECTAIPDLRGYVSSMAKTLLT